MNEEIWKWIPEYEGRYEVSSIGRVRSYYKPGKARKLSDTPIRIIKLNMAGSSMTT